MLSKDTAICIRTSDYSETSQIVTFFAAKTGKLDAIAKGSKRPKSPFDGPIEMFSHGKIAFIHTPTAKLATLTEFQQTSDFTALGSNLYILNCSLFAAELLNSLTDNYDPHPELFDSFRQFLQNVNESLDTFVLLILFQLFLLKEVGLQPVLNKCTNCKSSYSDNWPKVYFSSLANGLLCRDCEANFTDRITVTRQAAKNLADLRLITKAGEATLNEIEKLLIHHFTEILHRTPKMAKYVLKGTGT